MLAGRADSAESGDIFHGMYRVRLRPPVTAMPRPVYGALQRARQAALRLWSPLDAAVRKARRREALPPLWLRRHVGAVRHFESAAMAMLERINNLNIVRPDDHVLDMGCGTGVMAPGFARLLGPAGRYVGFDVHAPAIDWARTAFGADPRLSFVLADARSPYGKGSCAEPYRFPMADGEAGVVLAKSLFTHLRERDARHYLRETCRVLAPGRSALITAFLFARESRTGRGESPIFAFGDDGGLARWRWKARPESAMAYEREHFLEMASDAGLSPRWFCQGFFPGDGDHIAGQDLLLLER